MKRIIVAMLVAVLLLSLSACRSREAISAEEFSALMTEAGFTVENAIEMFDEVESGIAYFFIAIAGSEEFVIEFLQYETAAEARAVYGELMRILEEQIGNAATTEVNMPTFSRHTRRSTAQGRFGVVSRIENTVVFVHTDIENRDEVNAALDILGY